MFDLRIVVRVPITNEQSAYIYSIQIKKKPIGTSLDVAPTALNQIKVRQVMLQLLYILYETAIKNSILKTIF